MVIQIPVAIAAVVAIIGALTNKWGLFLIALIGGLIFLFNPLNLLAYNLLGIPILIVIGIFLAILFIISKAK